MSQNPRDTKFSEFARQLWQELIYARQMIAVGDRLAFTLPEREEAEQIIARRAYDLVSHVLDMPGMCFYPLSYEMKSKTMQPEMLFEICYKTDEMMEWIQDLTVWPESEAKE